VVLSCGRDALLKVFDPEDTSHHEQVVPSNSIGIARMNPEMNCDTLIGRCLHDPIVLC
jgi:hypothetical protein